ncbi:hypothetical protein PV328_008803 [Microctonus aethiopoides]|uniref:DNA ligase n=1 Tax=Microctonus aethiopoides TaxID=144406 RepID=A0AA39FK20_9HYME|nr:hypothetical protein PV328_008803 [Microctonus aethiopoides]
MSDADETELEKPFAVEKAKTGRAKCKKCKSNIDKDTIRIAKLMSNPFGEGKMKAWHHVNCLFEIFAKQRATTKKIDNPQEDIDGWDQIADDDKKIILEKIEKFENNTPYKKKRPASTASDEPAKKTAKQSLSSVKPSPNVKINVSDKSNDEKKISNHRDNTFRQFRNICAEVANASSYLEKTAIVKRMLTTGYDGDNFKGDIVMWCKMFLPMANKMIYNLQSKQLVKLFARIFILDENDMIEDLEQGDVAETIQKFFQLNNAFKPNNKSSLTVHEVYSFLEQLSQLTKEDEQIFHFKSIITRCTSNDLKMIIRLIKHDLRINAGPKHILEAIGPDVYRAYQLSHDLDTVLKRFTDELSKPICSTNMSKNKTSPQNKVMISLMTPVFPMLAEACTSVEMAMKKCPNGMLSEVKYDGERVQVHKQGEVFCYFSRSLKPVLPHKVNHFKEFIPKAFPDGDDLILDSEILMIDTKTGQPLPFGTLGVHKKAEFKDATVCIIIFDCLYYNGDILLNKTMAERREILKQRMTTIPNRVVLSEVQEVYNPKDLAEMIAKVLKMGLEGLVLKDMNSLYEPGKRHWLKIKKDYLLGGAMADSADLVVLGAWYGTGNKGGLMSIFLMGCYDEDIDKWVTVTKVHSGHDDATLDKLQKELEMIKIGKDPNLVPNWLKVNKPMVPDFISADPKKSPVWEITGAEFTNQGVHTADSISIRFPRVTRIRSDKNWSTATSLKELKKLFQTSSESIDVSLLLKTSSPTCKINKAVVKKKNSLKRKHSVDCDEENEEDNLMINTAAECSGENKQNIDGKMSKQIKISEKKVEDCIQNKIEGKYYEIIGNDKIKGVLGGLRVVLSDNIMTERRKILSQTLITLGATVHQEDSSNSEGKITHVIHGKKEITEQELRKWKFVGARHVNESWIESAVNLSTKPQEFPHAVNLRGSYCNCKCLHR